MELSNVLAVGNRAEFRDWLAANHDREKECWAVVKRGRPKDEDTFWYLDAVEEALCFGWIDSTIKKLESGEAIQRFSPRRKGSAWTELNKERCRRLERLGLMTDAGRAVLPDLSDAGFTVDDRIWAALREDPQVWEQFQAFPGLYQRVRLDGVQRSMGHPEIFENRLQKLIENTRAGVLYGDWNDYGRLL